MNPFLSDYNHRLQAWKQARSQIQQVESVTHKMDIALKFWQQAPEDPIRLDWDACDTWPDPWRLLHDNQYCADLHSVGVAYTLLLAAPNQFTDLRLHLIWSKKDHVQRVVVHTQGYCLNWGWLDRQDLNTLQNMSIQDSWHWTNNEWHSLRPK